MFPARIPIVSSPPSGFQNTSSLDFDGSDDVVALASSVSAGTSSTVSIWLKRDSAGTNDCILGEDDNSYDQFIRIYGGGGILYVVIGSVAYTYDDSATWDALNTTDWIHIVFTRATVTGKIYINGALKETHADNEADPPVAYSGNTVFDTIGAKADSAGNYTSGLIDEVAVWNAALSAGSVSTIYNSGVPTDLLADSNSGDLQGWWRFEEGSGTSATDSSANSNTGTLTNGPAYSTDVPS